MQYNLGQTGTGLMVGTLIAANAVSRLNSGTCNRRALPSILAATSHRGRASPEMNKFGLMN
jgi:hypothetical protein